jgi:ligand-binding sensor domain-containing protein/signal transduction histidine kinase
MRMCCAIFLAVCPALHAQQQAILFGHVSNEIGLAIAGQHCIVQDSRGFIWFGGDNGLYRYDGHNLKPYRHDPLDSNSIPVGEVSTICEDRNGVLWVAVENVGFERFDVNTGRFTHFNRDPADSTSHRVNPVYTMLESHDGTLWLGSLRGAGEFDRERMVFKHHRHDPADAGSLDGQGAILYEDRSETLWVGSWGGGLNEYDRKLGTFRHYRHDSSDSNSLSDGRVHAICETSDGMLWIGTWGGGLDMFDRRTNRFKHFKHEPGSPESLSDNLVTSILQTKDGALWVGTWSGGLNLFDRRKETFRTFTHDPLLKNSLCDNKVTSLCEDKSGILWIGTRGGVDFVDPGRKRFAYQKITPPGVSTPQCDLVQSIFRDNHGRLWIGTSGGGVDRFGPSRNEYRHFEYSATDPGSLNDVDATSICQDASGRIWIATTTGLNLFDERKHRFVRFFPDPADSNSLADDFIDEIAGDKYGTLWIGMAMGGLDEYDEKNGRFKHHRHSETDPRSVSDNHVVTITIDRQERLWIGTAYGGLESYDRNAREFLHHVHDPKNPSSLSSNCIRALHEDKNDRFWVRTDIGLDLLDRETGICIHYTTNDELNQALYSSLNEDDDGNLWYSTKFGIAKLITRTGVERIYNISDDLEIYDSQDIIEQDVPGQQRLFLGSIRGLLSFSPDSIKDNSFVPPIVITGFKKFNKEYKLPKDITVTEDIVLSHDDDVFSFDFAALNFSQPERNQYAYKLEGFDRDWVFSGPGHTATYTHLDPGEYVFRVKGSNNDGLWNERGTSILVTIVPPFWARWWFRILAVVTLFLSIGGGIRYVEIRKLKRRIELLEQERALERERTRISQDMHDEVGAGLSEIGILSELAKKNIQNPQDAEIHMQRVSETSRETIASIGEIIWAINPKNDLLDDLVAYLRHYTARYLGPTGITLEFDTPETIPHFHLSAESRRNIFLVMKETLHNIVKHSGATAVITKVSFTKVRLDILVKDNGKGFSASDTSRFGNGLHNMEKRMKSIGGEFVIESKPGEGTSVAIALDL